ncbi:Do family serine endopeptidase [candidate division KSB1 bacterium]|nr:Do family serine endopeptidase [candidate division KSB1 bacterium]
MKSHKITLLVIGSIFIGIIGGLIIASNFEWTDNSVASQQENSKGVVLGSEKEPLKPGADLAGLENAFVKVAKEVKPSVVTITSAKIIKYRRMNPFSDFFNDDFFRYFFRQPENRRDRDRQLPEEEEFRQQGLGSGVIISSDGYIITNNHVIKDADEITVLTIDNKEYQAEIIGADAKTDVAVIKIDEKNLPAIRLGDSDKIEVGQLVMAVGNPFSAQLEHTVTHGIISAKGRSNFQLAQYEDFIQTDAAINPGNSGGALVNLRGELIGINTAIISGSGGNVGIGFAIPVNMARHVMEMLIDKGHVVRGWLGVMIQGIDDEMAQALDLEEARGALVAQVMEDSPAEKAGFKTEDVILEFDGKDVRDQTHLTLMIASTEPNKEVTFKVKRGDRIINIDAVLGERPDDKEVATTSREAKSSEKLGIKVETLTSDLERQYGYENERGVVVTYVSRASIAYREGIREGDLIKEINRKQVKNVSDFNDILDAIKPNGIVFIRLRKGDDHYYVSFKMPKE